MEKLRTAVVLVAVVLVLIGISNILSRFWCGGPEDGAPTAVTMRGTATYRVTLDQPLTAADVAALQAAGGRIIDELSPQELLVESAPSARAMRFSSSAVWRVTGGSDKLQEGLDTASSAPQFLTVLPLAGDDLAVLEKKVVELGGKVDERAGEKDGVPRLRVHLPGTSIVRLADVAEVQWIERYARPRLLNDVAVKAALMNVESVRRNHGLTGRGQVITTSDSGVDTGDFATMHADLRTNLVGFARSSSVVQSSDVNGHGTHTAGSIVGTGARSDGQFKGVACEAKLWAWFCQGSDGYIYTPSDCNDLFRPSALGPTNAYIHSASWGGTNGVYNSDSKAIDTWCWNHPDFLPVFAAGNEEDDRTICCEGAAKNVLCIGATENYRPKLSWAADNPDEIAYFSSRGPMPDGRIKPDICAPGTFVVSTRSSVSSKTGWGIYDEYYLYNGGTSMATPLTAGTVALIRQWLVEQAGFTNPAPSSALMKAIITGGATRLGSSVPNKDFGWGRVNLAETLFPSNGLGVALKDYIPFAQNSVESFFVTVTNAASLDVQLCWVDYPASTRTAGTKSLVVDLDLVVSNETTGTVYAPNDHVNNLESVHVDAAEPGKYAVYVRGPASYTQWSSDAGGAAAVYVRGAFKNLVVETNEYVTVTIAAEGGSGHSCTPSVGSYSYVKGSSATFSAGKYANDGGADYCFSGDWNLDLERYALVGWQAAGVNPSSGTNATATLLLTNDVTLTWRWVDQPSEVGLWLTSYDDYRERQMYPGQRTGNGWWMPYGEEVTVTAENAPILSHYESPDGGLTVPVNGSILVNYNNSYRLWSFGTLKLSSFRVLDESGNYSYAWDDARNYCLPEEISLTMAKFTAVVFGYADETDANPTWALPYWWVSRHLLGPYQNGLITQEQSYSTGDPDGDGFDNKAEYEEPTDPMDRLSFPFRFTELTATGLTFIGSTAGDFHLQHIGKLGDKWTNVVDAAIVSTSVTNTVVIPPPTDAAGYYRVIYEDKPK